MKDDVNNATLSRRECLEKIVHDLEETDPDKGGALQRLRGLRADLQGVTDRWHARPDG